MALLVTLAVLAYSLIRLDSATTLIDEQKRQIQEQKDLIDKKETFGTAMQTLLEAATSFDGVRFAALVPLDHYQAVADQAYSHRWSGPALDVDTAEVRAATTALTDLLAAATVQATTNASGTTNEAVIDQLGGGYVASVLDDADTLCQSDVLACVVSDDPYTVHFDVTDSGLPYMNDFLRTGIAYHEFAHVLQMTNPGPTETALAAFGGDQETMADCFALTFLDGWKLDHRIFVSPTQYWDVSIGYGYTCNETQKQVVRDWYGQLGIQVAPIEQ